MLLGLCLMGVFSSLHADETNTEVKDTTTTIVSDTTITTPETKDPIEQTNEGCNCGKKKN